jgi:hypothetical protein
VVHQAPLVLVGELIVVMKIVFLNQQLPIPNNQRIIIAFISQSDN